MVWGLATGVLLSWAPCLFGPNLRPRRPGTPRGAKAQPDLCFLVLVVVGRSLEGRQVVALGLYRYPPLLRACGGSSVVLVLCLAKDSCHCRLRAESLWDCIVLIGWFVEPSPPLAEKQTTVSTRTHREP